MTTEFILLVGLFAFIILGGFLGKHGPGATFQASGARLGARLERNIGTGLGFMDQSSRTEWLPPPGPAPTGAL
jgi:hypothetical protein